MSGRGFRERIPRGLIVSCQLDRSEPLHTPQHAALFAEAAAMGGAIAVRIDGLESIKEVRSTVRLPIIGCVRTRYPDDLPLATPSVADADELIRAGVDVVAVDGTARHRPMSQLDGIGTVAEIRKRFPQAAILADISTFEEGVRALDRGADAVSTVLFGRTPATFDEGSDPEAHFSLIERLSTATDRPVLAEGFLYTTEESMRAMEAGAYAAVVGAAITRPRIITRLFCNAIDQTL